MWSASRDRVRDLVSRGHDQRRLALLVHTAEPTCVGKQLTLLPGHRRRRLAYLHRHTAARAGVAIAGNYNRFSSSSFHSRPPYPGRDLAIFGCELGHGLLGSLSLASLRRSAIAELAGPALKFPGAIERMMFPKFLGRLEAL
jgi:hypothetical protein